MILRRLFPTRCDRLVPVLRRRALGLLALLLSAAGVWPAWSAGAGDEVVVIYNLDFAPDSRVVAEHYAKQRGVPAKNLIGLTLLRSEDISRAAFRDSLQRPLVRELESRGLARFQERLIPAKEGAPGGVARVLTESKVRYLVLAYGVPLRIDADPKLDEDVPENLPAALRRNEAAVDSELAALPLLEQKAPVTGPLRNPFCGTTNFAALHPTNGLFLVTRLDGPSQRIASELVDKAMQAETNGLWGRAYFDTRGLTNGPYANGDEWIRQAYLVVRRQGFESILDPQPATFPASFPMPQIAIYAGWYDGAVSGPFTRNPVEFMPGAIAYHLHSFSARTIRSATANWVGPFLAKGVTATMGCVAEPYLDLTPHVGVFFNDLIAVVGNFAEAAYASQPVLSWQTTLVGDPLYRPMARPPQELHEDLERRKSDLLAWSHLRVVDLNLATGAPPQAMIDYLKALPLTKESAVLAEKLADLQILSNPGAAIRSYQAALKLKPSPNEKLQLQFTLMQALARAGREAEALKIYDDFFAANPRYPDLIAFYQEALALAKKVGDTRRVERYEGETVRLTPQLPASATNEVRLPGP